MTSSRGSKPVKRERQRITRTACEPCREKRAKCDGETPCGRCQTRNLDCHFTQRTWASKRSLQDEAASLREQVLRRDRVLDAICASDSSGDDIVRMLRDGNMSYDEAFDKIQGNDPRPMNLDTSMGNSTRQHMPGNCDCETCWSPSTINSNMLSSTSSQSPFSFMDSALGDETMSQPSTMPEQIQQQPNPLQQQMDPVQSIPWASNGQNVNSFGMMEGPGQMSTQVPPLSTGVAGDCPTIIDPMLWPPPTTSDPLGQPMLNSWTGLMGLPNDGPKGKSQFPVMG